MPMVFLRPAGWGSDIRKAFTNAPSWRTETSQLSTRSQGCSNSRCLWVWLYP